MWVLELGPLRLRNIANFRKFRTTPRTETNLDDGRPAIMDHQTVSTPNDCDQSVGAVIAVFVLLAFVVKVVVHSAATMDAHN
jgi:hypothetical protein